MIHEPPVSAVPPDGFVGYFQGRPIGPDYQYERPTGLEPGSGYVHLEVADLEGFAITEGILGVDTRAGGEGKGLKSIGTLHLSEQEAGEVFTTQIEAVCLAEHAIEVATAFDDGSGIVRVAITDIRFLWKTRGIVFGWFNVLRTGATPPTTSAPTGTANVLPAVAAPSPPKPAPSFGEAFAGGTLQGGGTELLFDGNLFDIQAQDGGGLTLLGADAPTPAAAPAAKPDDAASVDISSIFMPGSLKDESTNGTKLRSWNLDELLALALANLPGSPTLKRVPDELAGDKAQPVNIIWNGRMAKDCLADLMAEYRLILALNLDGSASFWRDGEGPLVLQDGTRIDDSDDGFARELGRDEAPWKTIAWKRKVVTYHYTPIVAIVLGPAIVKTAIAKLDPVGELKGSVVDIANALLAIGLTTEQARRFPFLSEDEKTRLGVTSDGIREFDRWAFKMFRIPFVSADGAGHPPKMLRDDLSGKAPKDAKLVAGIGDNTDKLPIKDRGLVDASGEFLKPKVWSESAIVVSAAKVLETAKFLSNTSARAKLFDDVEKLKALVKDEGDDKQAAIAVKISQAIDEYYDGLEKIRAKTDKVSGSEKKSVDEVLASAKADKDRILKDLLDSKVEAYKKAAKSLDKATQHLVLFNLPFGLQSSGFTIDRERGIVHFHAIQGIVDPEAVPPEQGRLRDCFGNVMLEWGYELKPNQSQPLSIEHRYYSAWKRNGTKAEQLSSLDVLQDSFPTSVQPLVIERPDLLQIVDSDGATNKAALDKIANAVVNDVFRRPSSTTGGIVQFCRPIPVETNGRVKHVTWKTEALKGGLAPCTEARIDCEKPAPAARVFETYARPRQGENHKHGGPGLPGGLKK